MSSSLPRVAVIGAGSSGITALKTLAEQGFDVTCLRGVGSHRRQLGLREQQRDVGLLPRPAHQHLAAEDGVLRLPDAGVLPGLPAARPDRRLLRRLRRSLRDPRPHPLRDEGRARGARGRRDLGHPRVGRDDRALRRAARRQRPPLGPALARAGVPRQRGLPGRAAARARVHEPRRPARQGRRRPRHGEQRDGHRGRVLATSRRTPTSPPAAARGSSRSTSSGGRRTS